MSNSFSFSANNPIADLPSNKLERAMSLRNGLVALCEGGSNMNDAVYRLLRRELMEEVTLKTLVPPFVRTTQDTAAMWAFLKGHSGHWEPRRQFVREQFAPLIRYLETGAAPVDTIVSDVLHSFDAESIF